MTSPPQPTSSGARAVHWLLLLAALVAAGWLIRRPPVAKHLVAARVDPMAAVPPGPMLLVSVDVDRLGPGIAADLLHAGGKELLGLRELCGFEPLLALRQVVVAVPPATDPKQASDFALIAATTLQVEPVLRCAEALIRKRGGAPVRSRVGHFMSVRDQVRPLGEVAIRADGLFVLSGGPYFRQIIDVASGTPSAADEPARLRAQLHSSIRKRLAPSQVLVTLLPEGSLPLPGVQAVGLGFDLQSQLLLHGFVGCRSEPDCGRARQVIDGLRVEMQNEAGLSGLSTLELRQHQVELELSARLPREQLVPLLAQLAN